jgi:hypothetical protein
LKTEHDIVISKKAALISGMANGTYKSQFGKVLEGLEMESVGLF